MASMLRMGHLSSARSLTNPLPCSFRNFSTTPNLSNKRMIITILRRRKYNRLCKMRVKYANDIAQREATKSKWENDRYAADLELVWRQNGLEQEPPLMNLKEKEQKLREWFECGHIYNVMSHEELSDYNQKLPIKSKHNQTQPWVWRSLENPQIPRHQRSLFESENLGFKEEELEKGISYKDKLLEKYKARDAEPPLILDPDTIEGLPYFKTMGKIYERKRAKSMDKSIPSNSYILRRDATGKKKDYEVESGSIDIIKNEMYF